jgi:hypothetical protein
VFRATFDKTYDPKNGSWPQIPEVGASKPTQISADFLMTYKPKAGGLARTGSSPFW